MLPTMFRFIWPSGFIGEDLKKSTNQKQELLMAAMFVNDLCQVGGFIQVLRVPLQIKLPTTI
jgi:hypothetical protein